uniref:Uncharacterized protein n=1 Tax=Parascaris univalens TaxID=6257 RepID=A0A915A3W9_PARUN
MDSYKKKSVKQVSLWRRFCDLLDAHFSHVSRLASPADTSSADRRTSLSPSQLYPSLRVQIESSAIIKITKRYLKL